MADDTHTHSSQEQRQSWALDTDEVVDIAHLCRAVYGREPYGQGWKPVSGKDLGLPERYLDTLGYINRNAVAFVREEEVDGERTLAIVFRGTNPGSVLDWRDNILGINRHYTLMAPLVKALDDYVERHGVSRVIAAGHSLGGAMAELFMLGHQDTDRVRYLGCTFGSPGARIVADYEDRRVQEFRHDDDVVPKAGRCFLAGYFTPGKTVEIERSQSTSWPSMKSHSMRNYILSMEMMRDSGLLAQALLADDDISVNVADGTLNGFFMPGVHYETAYAP